MIALAANAIKLNNTVRNMSKQLRHKKEKIKKGPCPPDENKCPPMLNKIKISVRFFPSCSVFLHPSTSTSNPSHPFEGGRKVPRLKRGKSINTVSHNSVFTPSISSQLSPHLFHAPSIPWTMMILLNLMMIISIMMQSNTVKLLERVDCDFTTRCGESRIKRYTLGETVGASSA